MRRGHEQIRVNVGLDQFSPGKICQEDPFPSALAVDLLNKTLQLVFHGALAHLIVTRISSGTYADLVEHSMSHMYDGGKNSLSLCHRSHSPRVFAHLRTHRWHDRTALE